MNRRTFLAGALAAAGPAFANEGSEPVRATPLRAGYFGTQYYDEQERQQLGDVLDARQPFRWYGPGTRPPQKAATFEKELAAGLQTRLALAVTEGKAGEHTAMAALD